MLKITQNSVTEPLELGRTNYNLKALNPRSIYLVAHLSRQSMKEQGIIYVFIKAYVFRSIYLVGHLAWQWMTREQRTPTTQLVWWVIKSGPVLVCSLAKISIP